MLFRKVQHGDYDDIVEICKDIWDGADYLPKLFHKWVEDKGYFMAGVRQSDHKVVVIGKYSVLPDGSGWLEGLRVHPAHQGQGLAREITLKILEIAKQELEAGKIKKIGMSTHITSAASIHLMEQSNFKLIQEHITLTKEYASVDQNLKLADFQLEEWPITFSEFQSLKYFKDRENYLTLAFVFQAPTYEVFEELKEAGAFVIINGFKGIFKLKGEPYFIAIEDNFESINTFMNYYCLKYKEIYTFTPLTTILPWDQQLIDQLKNGGFTALNNWESDYYYYAYEK